jgi:hypothetical protein
MAQKSLERTKLAELHMMGVDSNLPHISLVKDAIDEGEKT